MGIDQEEPDFQRRYDRNLFLAKIISAILICMGAVMGPACLSAGTYFQAGIAFGYCALFLVVLIFLLAKKKLGVFYVSIVIFAVLFELQSLYTGGTEGFSIIWMGLAPIFGVYLLSAKRYYILCGAVFFLLVLGFWTPLNQFCYYQSVNFNVRYTIFLFAESLFGVVLKNRIEKTENSLESQRNILTKEIKNAAIIQRTFLSEEHQTESDWSLKAKNIPMVGVSGDLFCIFDENERLDGVGVFDISGHGISSGLLTMLAKNIIDSNFYDNVRAEGKEALWETVERINIQFSIEKGEVPNYLTGIIVKITGNSLELVNAGHPDPILYRKSAGTLEYFKKDARSIGAIGITGFASFYVSQNLEMESGDELILFTDGLTECVNENDEEFGDARLLESVKKHIDLNVDEQSVKIIEDVNAFRNKKSSDDITLLILRKN